MILQKFFIVALMCFLTSATPADVTERDLTSTMPDSTTTAFYDSRQNEVDTKFLKDDETTTMSDIDEKIESIESDFAARAFEDDDNVSTTEIPLSMDELNESTTIESKKLTTFAIENSSQMDTTTVITTIAHELESLEGAQEPKSEFNLERSANNEKEESTTFATTQTMTSQHTTTSSSSTTTELTTPTKSSSTDKHDKEKAEISERAKALQHIKQIVKAHVLRTVFSAINDARKRQQAQESQVVEDSMHAASGSKCEYEKSADVSTDDDDKIIAFDKDSQRYVYMDKEDYERLLASHRSSHRVNDDEQNNLTPSPRRKANKSKNSSRNSIKKYMNSDESRDFSPPCVSCSLEGYEHLLNY